MGTKTQHKPLNNTNNKREKKCFLLCFIQALTLLRERRDAIALTADRLSVSDMISLGDQLSRGDRDHRDRLVVICRERRGRLRGLRLGSFLGRNSLGDLMMRCSG